LNYSEKIVRKKFFSILGIGVLAVTAASLLPFKLFKSPVKVIRGEKIKIAIHPSAVKRTNKA